MKVGAVFPQTEIGADVEHIVSYAEGVESYGFDHVLAYDHVVGADPAVHRDWAGPYDVHTMFHEPFVLFGFLAGVTRKVELVPGVIILPQRQTPLVAKQAAQVDVLSRGRLRLGVGVGWNRVEYDALGQDFSARGRRMDDQVALLRRLWTEQSVSAEVGGERVVGAGLSPLPVQQPIPLWFGGGSVPAWRRIGRVADGWFPQMPVGPDLDRARAVIADAAAQAGRDAGTIGMEGRLSWKGSVARAYEQAQAWESAGATHLTINTMGAGLRSVHDHLAVLAELADVLDLRRSVR